MSLEVEITGTTGRMVIAREQQGHSWSWDMWAEGAEMLQRLGADPAIRVIVIDSTGDRVFSGGADLSVLTEIDGNLERARQLVDRVEGLMASIEAASKPVIAAVSGAAIGAGAEIAAACDIRLASRTARFGVPAAHLGVVITRTDVARLVRMAGTTAARDMLLTGRIFTAEEALAAGMVRSVHPPAELRQAVDELADRLATLSSTALSAMKTHLNAIQPSGPWDDTAREHSVTALASAEVGEQARAALAVRKQTRS